MQPIKTEQEWLACDDPGRLLRRARFRSHRRKSRLFAVACCRCIWRMLVDERSRMAVEVAERHADGAATDDELAAAARAADAAHHEMYATLGKVGSSLEWAALYAAHPDPFHGAKNVSWMAAWCRFYQAKKSQPDYDDIHHLPCRLIERVGPLALLLGRWKVEIIEQAEATGAEKHVQAALLRCIFGNPFRPVAFDPTWLTSQVMSLAQAAYDHRNMPGGTLDPTRLGILADALEEAGCTEQSLLDHLRSLGPHVRGCWPLDRCLAKD
jgi:hypothetical protein